MPPLTPLGQQLMSKNKPQGRFGPAGTNDPYARYCDPFGFPRNVYQQGRALSVATMPGRIVFLLQHGSIWREVWMDGRALPANVGGTERDALDPTYNGYSVGHWENDDTLVIDTTGIDDKTWVNAAGVPHSVNAHVQERWTRIDHNNMKVSLTIDDPKMYTKPFSLGSYNFKWVPNQKINEWLCIPSEMAKYLKEQGDPAGSTGDLPPQSLGGRRQ
jgi:hypothetical protein